MRASYKRVTFFLALVTLLAFVVLNANAQDDVAAQVLRRINRARGDANLPALERNAQLDAAAQGHADDLLRNGAQLGHRGSDGSNIKQRIARAGYDGAFVGENWAGYRTLDKIFEFWLSDPPHRKNILNTRYAQIGIGIAQRTNGGYIVVTDFGTLASRAESSAVQAPTPQPRKKAATAVPTKAKPTPKPTRKPTMVPTSIPTAVPTRVPTVARVAMVAPPPPKVFAPLRARGKMARIVLQGRAESSLAPSKPQADVMRLWLGGALSVGGALLLGVAIAGHRRQRFYR